MFLRNYTVRIIGPSKEAREREGYVFLADKARYSIQLANNNTDPCEAQITIDGKEIGVFLLGGNFSGKNRLLIERPVNTDKRFMFLKGGKKPGKAFIDAGLDQVDADLLGVVAVTFTPGSYKYVERSMVRPLRGRFIYNGDAYVPLESDSWRCRKTQTTVEPLCDSYNKWQPFETNSETSLTAVLEDDIICSSNAKGSYTPGGTGLQGQSNQHFIDVDGLHLRSNEAVTVYLRLVADDKLSHYKKITELKPVSSPIPPPIRVK